MKNSNSQLLTRLLLYGFIPALAAFLVISKVFFFPSCFAFDKNDAANHAFVNLFAARSILKAGELPMMNLYNNFGTPLLGDAVTYPFSIQSLTYWFFPDPLAMTINRALIAFFTLACLIFYFRKRFSPWAASVCSLLVILTPGFLLHFPQHHYQMSVLLFTLLLICQDRFTKSSAFFDFFLLYLVLAVSVLSTSINLLFLIFPLLLANQFFLSGMKLDRKFVFILIAIAAALIFYYPEVLNFFRAVAQSERIGEGYGIRHTARELFSGVIGQTGTSWRHHEDAVIYFSLSLLVTAGFGSFLLFKKKENHGLAIHTFLLGILPIPIVLILLLFKSLHWSIPLIKSTDITRIWWFTNIFLMIPVGSVLDSVRKQEYSQKSLLLLALITGSVILAIWLFSNWNEITPAYKLPMFFFMFFLVCLFLFCVFKTKLNAFMKTIIPALMLAMLTASLLWAQVPLSMRITGLDDCSQCSAGHYFSDSLETEFQPQAFIKKIRPYSRLATELPAIGGQDLRAIRHHVFGSNGRSVLVDKSFADFLKRNQMLAVDQTPLAYHFVIRPANQEVASRLGIQYIIAKPRPDLVQSGWRVVDQFFIYFLYENPQKVGLVYFQENGRQIPLSPERLHFRGNGLIINLPELSKATELVATFLNMPGWRAWSDYTEKKIYAREDHLMRIRLNPGERVLTLRYVPFEWYHALGGVLLSFLLITFVFCFGKSKSKKTNENQAISKTTWVGYRSAV